MRTWRGDVDAYLVEERDGADGPAKVHLGLVELDRVDALLDARESLHRHWAERAVDVETGDVLHRDHGLPLTDADVDGGRGHGLGRLVVRDHLEQLHHLRRREVVHAHDVLRALGLGGDVANGQSRRVGRDDGVLWADGLHLLNDGVLDAELLEDSLDHQVGVGKVPRP